MAEAIEQFVILAKTAKGRACAALIQQILADKRVFVFGEILAAPSVQEASGRGCVGVQSVLFLQALLMLVVVVWLQLAGTEHEPHLRILELFAYGKYKDYAANPAAFPELNDAKIRKLRMLTIVQLAQEHTTITYEQLQEELQLDNVRVLEDLIIDTIYAGLLRGKLNQQAGVLRVKDVMARDVRLEQLDDLIEHMSAWQATADALLETIDKCVTEGEEYRQREQEQQKRINRELTEKKHQQMPGASDFSADFDPERMYHGRSKRTRAGLFGFRGRF